MNGQFLEEQKKLFSGSGFNLLYTVKDGMINLFITDSARKKALCGFSSLDAGAVEEYIKRKLKIILFGTRQNK